MMIEIGPNLKDVLYAVVYMVGILGWVWIMHRHFR